MRISINKLPKTITIIGVLWIAASAEDIDKNKWQSICGADEYVIRYVLGMGVHVQFNPDDSCYYILVNTPIPIRLKGQSMYNDHELSPEVIEVNSRLRQIVDQNRM